MKKLYASIIALILLAPILACCQSNPKPVGDSVKTGDIMVVAHGCTAPPYEYGLKLVLNRMPEVEEPVIKIPIPDSLKGDDRLFRLADDTIILLGKSPTQYIIDTLYDTIIISQSVQIYDDHKFAEVITDSLGHYIFKNVPIGRYQLIVSDPSPFDTGVSTSNELFSDRKDFPIYKPYHPEVIEKFIQNTTGIWENRMKSDKIFSPTVVCKKNIMNDLEVKFNCISIVKTAMIIYNSREIYKPLARFWQHEYRERGK